MANVLKGKTAAGFAYEVDPDALNDMEVLEDIAEVEKNPLVLPKVITAVLGKDQKNALYDHYRNENGRVPADVITTAFVEILTSSNQGKN
jgi:hypothetical protein